MKDDGVARWRVVVKGTHEHSLEGFEEFVYLVPRFQAGHDVKQYCHIIQRTDIHTVKYLF